jgi:hypothetical protein
VVGRVLCACVSEYHTDGEGAGSQELCRLSYTRKYISLAEDSVGVAVVITNGPVCMCEQVVYGRGGWWGWVRRDDGWGWTER